MSRRSKAQALAAEIRRRARSADRHDTSHLTALREVSAQPVDIDAAAARVAAQTPILADVIRRTGVVPEPLCSWEQGTTLLPLVGTVA